MSSRALRHCLKSEKGKEKMERKRVREIEETRTAKGTKDVGKRKRERLQEKATQGTKDAVTCGLFARVQSQIHHHTCARARARKSNLACRYRVKRSRGLTSPNPRTMRDPPNIDLP